MMGLYRCPFCKINIKDDIDSLNAHREPGGVCDQAMERIERERNDTRAD